MKRRSNHPNNASPQQATRVARAGPPCQMLWAFKVFKRWPSSAYITKKIHTLFLSLSRFHFLIMKQNISAFDQNELQPIITKLHLKNSIVQRNIDINYSFFLFSMLVLVLFYALISQILMMDLQAQERQATLIVIDFLS